MKKIFVCALLVLSLSSCYNVKLCVGDVQKNEPVVEVNSVMNHHLLYGLIPVGNTNINPKEYVGEAENYVVKYKWTFLDGFLSCLTCGIYTPTTTTFYLPLKEMGKTKEAPAETSDEK